MKCIYLLSSFFLFFIKIIAQPTPFPQNIDRYEIIDTALFVITYQLDFSRDFNNEQKDDDLIILQIGQRYSKSYSKTLYDGDSIVAEWIKKGARATPNIKKSVPLMDVYKDYLGKKSIITYRSILSGPVYKYEEAITPMSWTLSPDKKNILSYSCQKATSIFRGRTYEAWFTTDIPIPEGPWKFGGLPGLILSLKDDKGNYNFTCIGIEKIKQNTPIKYWLWDYQSIKREQLQIVTKRMFLNTYEYCISIDQPIGGLDPIEARKKLVYSYNPLELK